MNLPTRTMVAVPEPRYGLAPERFRSSTTPPQIWTKLQRLELSARFREVLSGLISLTTDPAPKAMSIGAVQNHQEPHLSWLRTGNG